MEKVICTHPRARRDYVIEEKFEAGISLVGQEVKSMKTRGVNLTGSYIIARNEEIYWIGSKIPAYQPKNAPPSYNPERWRKLLLKKTEIKQLIGKSKQKGLTLIPLRVYTKDGKIKIEFGITKGKKKFNKRELIKKRETEREIERTLKRGRVE